LWRKPSKKYAEDFSKRIESELIKRRAAYPGSPSFDAEHAYYGVR
jgi:hypothetical protein